MGYEYRLLRQVMKGTKTQPSDRQMMKTAWKATAEYLECEACGNTWSGDESDSCEDCDEE